MTHGARISLAIGLGLTALALGLTLTRSPPRLARTNWVPEEVVLASVYQGASACQADEELPHGTSAIRLSLQAVIGPRVTVEARSDGHAIAHGSRGAGWTAGSVTVPVASPPRTVDPVTICYTVGPTRGPLDVYGARTPPTVALHGGEGASLGGRMKIEYLRAGSSSWWSRMLSVARRIGLGHAAGGTWLALMAALLVLAMSGLASWLVVRELP
jgi:hypothetical protein